MQEDTDNDLSAAEEGSHIRSVPILYMYVYIRIHIYTHIYSPAACHAICLLDFAPAAKTSPYGLVIYKLLSSRLCN